MTGVAGRAAQDSESSTLVLPAVSAPAVALRPALGGQRAAAAMQQTMESRRLATTTCNWYGYTSCSYSAPSEPKKEMWMYIFQRIGSHTRERHQQTGC